MKRQYLMEILVASLATLIAPPTLAERLACKASYDATTRALSLDAVDVGANRYVVKLTAIAGGTTLTFKLASAVLTVNHDCFDPATISANTLNIPDLAVADSYYSATLTQVTGGGISQIDLNTSNPSTMQFSLSSSSKNPRLVPDAGLRIEKASNPFATVNSTTGVTYLGYADRAGLPESFQSATDGLRFSNATQLTFNNRSVDSRRTLMPDGKTWRLYQFSQTGVMTSYLSSDGNVFTAESGTRYTAPTTDNASTGVYDLYLAGDGALVMVYVGDLRGKNNLRMAKSIDNGVSFTFVKGNVLGDDDASGGGNTFIDNKTVQLADGRRRMFTMRSSELQSFVTTNGYDWTREAGTRVGYKDFASAGLTLYSLNDPVAVIDKDGRLKVYVATSTAALSDESAGNTNWAIVSATWNDNLGTGVLSPIPAPATSQTISFGAAPSLSVGGSATLSAIATSGLAITFASTTPSICSVSGNTVTGVAAGVCTVSASQAGDATFASATQVTLNITVTAVAPPGCALTATPSAIAAGASANLTSTCTPAATSFVWTGGTCAGTSASTCTVTPTATTTYTVTGANAGGAGASASATVSVSTPKPICSLTASPISIPPGGTSVVTVSCNPIASSYTWTGAGCAGTTKSSCTVTPSSTTTYTVTGTNASGSGAPASTVVAIAPPGSPVCTLSATPIVVSTGSASTLKATCSPAATSYTWSNSGFDATTSVGTVSPTKPTMYAVIGVNGTGSGAQTYAAVYVCNTPPSDNYLGLTYNGSSANETFSSGIGSDTIDGGPGFDTVIYNCNRDSFTIVKTLTGWTVSSKAEGIDTLANVERIRFGNETLALDISGNAGQAYRIYQAAFDRVPDNGGLKYWIGRMDAGTTLERVAAEFIGSPEFQALYGAYPSNAEFLTKLYKNVLHRTPDQGGYDWWLAELNAGRYDKVKALASFSESPENQAGVLNAILNGIDLLN